MPGSSERRESRSHFRPFPLSMLRTREEAAIELLRPCGQFASLITVEEKLRAFIADRMSATGIVSKESFLVGDGVPLNWQFLLSYLYDNKVVTSPHYSFRPQRNDRPKIFNAQLDFEHSESGSFEAGFGAAFSAEVAMSKAVGETLERYFLSRFDRSHAQDASFKTLKGSRIQPLNIHTLNEFLPWQKNMFPEFAMTEDAPLTWVLGEALESGRKINLPAQLVFWKYHYGNEKRLSRITTSGCAGHFSKEKAVLSALLELIQRDGFLIYWLNSLSPRVLDVSQSDDPEIVSLLGYLERYRLTATFLNTSSDIGVPSLTCVITDTSLDEPIISVGGGTGFTLKDMVLQSAIEALLVNAFAAEQTPYVLPHEYRPFTDARLSRTERLSLWRGAKMLRHFSFFTNGEKQDIDSFLGEAGTLSESEQLPYVLKRLRSLGEGYETYIYEVAHPILKRLGYHVVRAIVPQLFPLYLFENAPLLMSRRLSEVPHKLGFNAATTLNPWPHPFP